MSFKLFLLSFLCCFLQFNSAAQCRQRDSLTLVTIYNKMNGAQWVDPWDLTKPMTMWQGVYLMETGCIGSLYLSQRQVNSTLPNEIGDLSELTNLSLTADTTLSGKIPHSIGRLRQLQVLTISGCNFTDSLPDSLIYLKQLTYLTISNTPIGGVLPNNLGNLTNLNSLQIEFCKISGSLPKSIGRLKKLSFLSIQGNELKGTIPDSLGNLSSLYQLSLNHNKFEGKIPDSLGNLKNLKYLYLGNNQLSGSIPDSLANATNLEVLGLNNNQLSGSIPHGLGYNKKIKELYLNDNKLSGMLPISFRDLTNINKLTLENNLFKENIYPFIENLPIPIDTNGMTLTMSNNQFYGELPDNLMAKVKFFDAYNNKISGKIPNSFNRYKRYYVLQLPKNRIDSMPNWSNLGSNSFIDISDNKLTFDDIVPKNSNVVYNFNLSYARQDTILKDTIINIKVGNKFVLDLGIDKGLISNIYTWCKKYYWDENFCLDYRTLNNNKLIIDNIAFSDSGTYKCSVTNPNARNLTLFTGNIKVRVWEKFTQKSVRICEGSFYLLSNGRKIFKAGTYIDSINIFGQDTSVLELTVSVRAKDTTYRTTTTCDPSKAGIFTQKFANIDGCDSSIITTVRLLRLDSITFKRTICYGDSFKIGNIFYKTTGQYIFKGTNTEGCDSTVYLDLTVSPLITTNIDKILCKSDSLIIGGQKYDIQNPKGVLYLKSKNGCDSFVYINLSFNTIAQALPDVYTLPSLDAPFDFDVRLNDTLPLTPSVFTVVKAPTLGQLTQVSGSQFRFTPPFDFIDQTFFIYKVCLDACLTCDTAHVTLKSGSAETRKPLAIVITPESNNENSRLLFSALEQTDKYPKNTLTIYNRYGTTVFSASPYKNDWVGVNNHNAPLPAGVYYFKLSLQPTAIFFMGSVTILRNH